MSRAGFRFVVLLVFAAAATSQTTPPPTDRFLTGPPFTLEQLRSALGNIFEARLIKAIQSRGIDFAPEERACRQLQEAGASDSIIGAVKESKHPSPPAARVAPPALQTPKPEARAAPATGLVGQCDPAECEILIDGNSRGFTADGWFEIRDVPAGSVAVVYRKAGFVPVETRLQLTPGRNSAPPVTLLPTEETRQHFGSGLFLKMTQALGGPALAEDAGSIAASGTALVFDAKGQRTEWTLLARLGPGAAYFRMGGAGLDFFILLRNGEYRTSKSFARVAGTGDIETGLRLFQEYQLNNLINRMVQEKFHLAADVDVASHPGDLVLHADSAADRYSISVGPNFLPREVRYESGANLGSGLRVVYANYVTAGRIQYPKVMIVKLPDPSPQGVEFRFTTVTPNARFTGKDFR